MSASDAEREVLARIRGASRRSSDAQIAAELAALPGTRAAPLTGATLCDNLQQRLERNGATTAVAQTRRDAVLEISRFIGLKHRLRRVVTGHDPRLAALPWRDGGLLPRFDVAQTEDAVSVSYAYCAVAETGSLALLLNRNNPALNNLLVEDQIILVDRHDIHARLESIWDAPGLESDSYESVTQGARAQVVRPRGLMMISGPSSTADIAMQLVLGAHGPRALHVVIVGSDIEHPKR
ncbi:MAG: LUD domain-containing protein [Congregibacter sp.]|nr:LUD domain-containing protein [Congregibacter sp.]